MFSFLVSCFSVRAVIGQAQHGQVVELRRFPDKGVYGSGADAQKAIGDLGLDYWSVQHMANALSQGYGRVAQDVIDGRYGKDAARFKALTKAGYDPILVQRIVNGMVLDD